MADHFQISPRLIRNPLGIIALFVSLIYAMSAVLLGASINSLSADNQTVLVVFIVLFPVAVLAAFVWLVIGHHTKLYGPGDFRSDEGFLGHSPSKDLGQRLAEETASEATDTEAEERALGAADAGPVGRERGTAATASVSGESLSDVYLLEGLVFQKLQRELGGSVIREVAIDNEGEKVRVDGVIRTDKKTYAVEVKILHRLRSPTFEEMQRLAKQFANGQFTLILAIVTLGTLTEQSRDRLMSLRSGPIDVRIFAATDILTEFGIPAAREALA